MEKLQRKRFIRPYYALKLERMDTAEDWRQIKALPSAGDHPLNLDYTGENWYTGKMTIKIKQVAWSGQLDHGTLSVPFE